MFSGLLFYSLFLAALAASLSSLAAVGTSVYLRAGPARGLALLALLGLAGALTVGGEYAVPVILLSVILTHAVRRGWGFSRTVWTGSLLLGLLSLAYWVATFALLGPLALAEAREFLAEMAAGLRQSPQAIGLSEIDAAGIAGQIVALQAWVVAALPGFSVGEDVLFVFSAAAMLRLLKAAPWTGAEIVRWSVPLPCVWLTLLSGLGVVALLGKWPLSVSRETLRIVSVSGLSMGLFWFLIQGFLTGWVALRRWRIPRFMSLVLLLLTGRFLPLVGLVEVWAGFRERLLRPAAQEPGAPGV